MEIRAEYDDLLLAVGDAFGFVAVIASEFNLSLNRLNASILSESLVAFLAEARAKLRN